LFGVLYVSAKSVVNSSKERNIYGLYTLYY